MKISLVALLFLFSLTTIASTHTARVIKLENPSVIYVPGENKQSEFKHIKYLDEVYHIVPAKLGMKLDNGYIFVTGPHSKAKVIFNNGDHFFVSENTQYKINWKYQDDGVKEDASVIYLIRGAIRGMIQKDGPRSGMKVKVANAVMGVRGTDFFINEKQGDMTVTVLRGQVEITDTNVVDSKPIEVKSGQTLTVENKVTHVAPMTQQDLQEIATVSTIQAAPVTAETQDTKELAELEKKATETTLNDIKEYQPNMYKRLTAGKEMNGLNSDLLALSTVKIMEEKAKAKTSPIAEPTQNMEVSLGDLNFFQKKGSVYWQTDLTYARGKSEEGSDKFETSDTDWNNSITYGLGDKLNLGLAFDVALKDKVIHKETGAGAKDEETSQKGLSDLTLLGNYRLKSEGMYVDLLGGFTAGIGDKKLASGTSAGKSKGNNKQGHHSFNLGMAIGQKTSSIWEWRASLGLDHHQSGDGKFVTSGQSDSDFDTNSYTNYVAGGQVQFRPSASWAFEGNLNYVIPGDQTIKSGTSKIDIETDSYWTSGLIAKWILTNSTLVSFGYNYTSFYDQDVGANKSEYKGFHSFVLGGQFLF